MITLENSKQMRLIFSCLFFSSSKNLDFRVSLSPKIRNIHPMSSRYFKRVIFTLRNLIFTMSVTHEPTPRSFMLAELLCENSTKIKLTLQHFDPYCTVHSVNNTSFITPMNSRKNHQRLLPFVDTDIKL